MKTPTTVVIVGPDYPRNELGGLRSAEVDNAVLGEFVLLLSYAGETVHQTISRGIEESLIPDDGVPLYIIKRAGTVRKGLVKPAVSFRNSANGE